MFDLEQAILEWKESFRPDSSIEDDEAQEVEAHLRESIERLKKNALSDFEAFAVSLHRLGSTTALEAEFKKNQPVAKWRARLTWMVGGYLVLHICSSGAWAFAQLASAAMAYGGTLPTIAGPTTLATLATAWIGLLVLSYRLLFSCGPASNRFTWKWTVLTGLALYLLPVVNGWGQLAQKAFRGDAWYRETGMWVGYGGFLIQISFWVLCFVVLHKFSKAAATSVG